MLLRGVHARVRLAENVVTIPPKQVVVYLLYYRIILLLLVTWYSLFLECAKFKGAYVHKHKACMLALIPLAHDQAFT